MSPPTAPSTAGVHRKFVSDGLWQFAPPNHSLQTAGPPVALVGAPVWGYPMGESSICTECGQALPGRTKAMM